MSNVYRNLLLWIWLVLIVNQQLFHRALYRLLDLDLMLEVFQLLAHVDRRFHGLQPFHILRVSLCNPILLAHPHIDVKWLKLQRLDRFNGPIFSTSCIRSRFANIDVFVGLLKVLHAWWGLHLHQESIVDTCSDTGDSLEQLGVVFRDRSDPFCIHQVYTVTVSCWQFS